jgi:predicted CXXCH cytochrome family protein
MSRAPLVVPVLIVAAGLAASGLPGQATGPGPEPGSCTPCHTCDRPTPEHPCLRACLRHAGPDDAVEPAPAAPPPDVVILDDLEDLYEPVPFDHAVHADMAAFTTGCTTCHHHSPEAEPHPACRSCHEPSSARDHLSMPGLKGAYHRQCMSCHRAWSGHASCGACHRPKDRPGIPGDPGPAPGRPDSFGHIHAALRAEPTFVYRTVQGPGPLVTFHHGDHALGYGLGCVDCHRGDSCIRCHDGTAPRRRIEHGSSCLSCHVERSCTFCHDVAERPPFDHAGATGWSLEPYHRDVACSACHGPERSYGTPSSVCHACHVPRRAGADGLAGIAGPPSAHASATLDCLACHDEVRQLLSHANVVHGATAGGAGCTSCHGGAGTLSPRVPPDHRMELCLGCHDEPIERETGRPLANIAALLSDHPSHHGPVRSGDCTACHDPHASRHARLLVDAYPAGFYATFERDRYELCFRCHGEDRVCAVSGVGATGFREGDRNLHRVHVNRAKGRTCRACHEVHASSRPFHIREAVPFGESSWMLPINYEQTVDGGTCTPACHGGQSYRRGVAVAAGGP